MWVEYSGGCISKPPADLPQIPECAGAPELIIGGIGHFPINNSDHPINNGRQNQKIILIGAIVLLAVILILAITFLVWPHSNPAVQK